MVQAKNFVITEQNVEEYANKIGNWLLARVQSANAKGFVLGNSGGVDCATAAMLCKRAGIPVHLIIAPFGDNMERSGSMTRAMDLVNVGFPYHIRDIKPGIDAATIPDNSPLLKECNPAKFAPARINLMPRERSQYFCYFAALQDMLTLGTLNLIEFMFGYFTKFTDILDVNPLLLLTKQEVYILARFLEVPASILDAIPTAELEGQSDEEAYGLTYVQANAFFLGETSGCADVDALINRMIATSRHKREQPPFFAD